MAGRVRGRAGGGRHRVPLLGRRWPPGAAVGLLVAAGAGLVLAGAPALPGLRDLAEVVVTRLPGGGLIRDSQKFVALALAEAVCFGLGVERVLPALPVRWTRPAAAGLVVAPVLLLPALAWGAAGRLATVDYPPAFAEARAAMAADTVPGRCSSCPGTSTGRAPGTATGWCSTRPSAGSPGGRSATTTWSWSA